MKLFKRMLAVLFIVLIAVQFVPVQLPKTSNDGKNDLVANHVVNDQLGTVLKTSCYDCHSNQTHYPWYAHVAPVSWLIVSDVDEGRRKLNFSNWSLYDKKHQAKKLDAIKEHVEDGEMPVYMYTILHRNAKLSDDQRSAIVTWTENLENKLDAE